MSQSDEILKSVRNVIETEMLSLKSLLARVDDSFVHAVTAILDCKGKVVTTGVGKSGFVARKTASTLSSTGTLSVFLHPTEALHGDLGLVASGDVVLAFGKSGESEEFTQLIPALKRIGTKIISVTGNVQSTLAKSSDVVIDASVECEACPLDLAPTSSVVTALAVGDALALTLMKLKSFGTHHFALYHPGGRIGQRLTLRVSDVIVPLEKCLPLHPDRASLDDVMAALGKNLLGIVLFSRDGVNLDGILTDGDLRRALGRYKEKIFSVQLSELITRTPITVAADILAVEALKFMEERERPLNAVPVVEKTSNGKQRMIGIIRLHELVKWV